MEEVAGTVKDIRKGSRNLAKALAEGGHRIIISTEQKFSFALPKLKEAAGSHFAVIIDEAHTAFGKQASHDVRQVLTDKSELRETVEESVLRVVKPRTICKTKCWPNCKLPAASIAVISVTLLSQPRQSHRLLHSMAVTERHSTPIP